MCQATKFGAESSWLSNFVGYVETWQQNSGNRSKILFIAFTTNFTLFGTDESEGGVGNMLGGLQDAIRVCFKEGERG